MDLCPNRRTTNAHRPSTTAFLAAVALVSISAVRVNAQAPAAAPKLDDPHIVAIFDNANTWDIETGKPPRQERNDQGNS